MHYNKIDCSRISRIIGRKKKLKQIEIDVNIKY